MTFKQSPPGFKNVEGPLVEAVQKKLDALGFAAGVVDGVWGSNTLNALRAWQTSQGLAATGVIDDQTWNGLMAAPVPILSRRALQLTAAWEGTGYGGTNGNFDNQGITWGLLGFTWGNNELQGILGEIQTQYPAIFNAAFGPLATQITQIMQKSTAAQMAFAVSISTNGGNNILPEWAAAFKALGDAPEVQSIENARAQNYWNAGQQLATKLGLQSETAQALCFDVAVQLQVSDAMIKEILQNFAAGMSDSGKMLVVANKACKYATNHQEDVLARKMTFATGQGPVHGDQYDITCWGIG